MTDNDQAQFDDAAADLLRSLWPANGLPDITTTLNETIIAELHRAPDFITGLDNTVLNAVIVVVRADDPADDRAPLWLTPDEATKLAYRLLTLAYNAGEEIAE
jgi:hypothetical protein